ncbi:hypothetical protein CIK69_04110, partial [Brachybacterium alimentarium]
MSQARQRGAALFSPRLPSRPVTPSPRHPVTPSPRHPVTPSPRHRGWQSFVAARPMCATTSVVRARCQAV